MFLDNPQTLSAFRRRLLRWYQSHARELPWRETTDPYRIWVSEIMLQQTTTQTVKGYFDRFIERFPDVRSLAAAPVEQVYRLWEGLGYYRRCTQMHRAAQEIVRRFGGVFPDREEDVRELPGIGRYTAGAILSIAFDRRVPILEANTIRLHARLLALRADPTRGDANKSLWIFAERILPGRHIGRFHQALMDLGSMVCTPKNPRCSDCPIASFCRSAQEGLQQSIPCLKAKETKEDRTEVALMVRKKGKILLLRYPQNGRWAGFWDFPRAESHAEIPSEIRSDTMLRERLTEMTGRKLEPGALLETIKHVVTRFRITLFFCEGKDLGPASGNRKSHETRWVSIREIEELPLHSTARKLFRNNLLF